jgi:hypothetical protein
MKHPASLLYLAFLVSLPVTSAAQTFQDFITTSESYGHISPKTKLWVWEPDSIIAIGASFDYNQLTFHVFGPCPVFYTLLTSELIKDNNKYTNTYRFDAIDNNGKKFLVLHSECKETSEFTIVQKDQSAVRYKMDVFHH